MVQLLREEIISGVLPPGKPLAEPVLARRFRVSRAPIREALIELERVGLVQFESTGRTRVRTLTQRDFLEIIEARVALESMAARRAAARWSAEDSAFMNRSIAAQGKASTLAELSRLDWELHEYVMRRAGNARLLTLWQGIRWQFEMCLAHTFRLLQKLALKPRQVAVESHRRLLAALASGKPETAARTMTTHIEDSLEWPLAEFPQDEARPVAVPRGPVSRGRARSSLVRLVLAALLGGWTLSATAEITPQDAEFFESKVRPVLAERCYECHSHAKKIKGGLVLDSRVGWAKGGESGPAVVPGNVEESLLLKAVSHLDKDLAMPPKRKLGEDEIAVLTEWVRRGAPDPRVTAVRSGADLEEGRKHWAFQPVTHPVVPESAFPEISQSPIDAFLFAAMAEHHLPPATLADRVTLLRRATYDLTGLPPTEAEVAAFVGDSQPEDAAFAAVIERLLASPAYGEKWGRLWLDLAHYADTTGCSSDWPIDDLWRYRDWVVAAFNDDMPFDQFLTEQIAGDLLAADMLKAPGALDVKTYRERLIATGFLATAKRFGSDPGSYDHLTIGDTLDTTWKALQGLTVGCARCHDHKFDPVMSSDYYALYGIFASSLYPYTGAEKNQNAMLVVPLDSPAKIEGTLDAWNRQLPVPAPGTTPRSVVASFSHRWGFEEGEVSEGVSDRSPVSPWVSQGGVAVREGNSPFVHLIPKGIKLVDFQATARVGEMTRRVRWSDGKSEVRSVAVDLQLTSLWDETTHRLKFAWRPEGEMSGEVTLASVVRGGLVVPGVLEPVALARDRWFHLALSYTMEPATVILRVWDDRGSPVVDSPAPTEVAAMLRGPGDLLIHFEADTVNDQRKACVRVDNVVAESGLLSAPDGVSAQSVPAPKRDTNADRDATYRAVLPKKPETAFAMWEGTPHDAAIQKRGEPASPGAVVPRRNLLLLGGQPVTAPRRESGRRDLARWLLDDANPLTLRVFVNRLWLGHFGRGIVASPNDFGHQGERPTHPELLDDLVQRFRSSGFSVKAMHREIMRSYAYRQSATPTRDCQQCDPDNRWLSHFSPRRLSAEEVRDSILLVAGKLDPAGAGYQQPFPALNLRSWTQHAPFSAAYEAGYAGYDHHKRSIYLPVVRFVADPFLATFDGADSNQSVAARAATAVPLQAMALLNAPFIVEAANALAELASPQPTDEDAVILLHRRIFGVEPDGELKTLLGSHLTRMTKNQQLSRTEALAVVAQSLLGSNAFLHVF
jgi:DNA-binding GntR family transcriptional regulator